MWDVDNGGCTEHTTACQVSSKENSGTSGSAVSQRWELLSSCLVQMAEERAVVVGPDDYPFPLPC